MAVPQNATPWRPNPREQAGFMTGQNLTLDGGMTVKMIYEE